MMAGIALAAWVAFRAPHSWHGAKVLGRVALGLGALGMISGGPKLIFPGAARGEDAGRDGGV